ncbi:hypothetical protein [Rhodovulum sulfidophilum]|uniref:hypothetical protein n=1 Tax=Rhodovulum sulfidophilum TaxID=35806 RepID=UPI001913F071|nr:hypothetical protein [Rhodovulum sulfidophilum]
MIFNYNFFFKILSFCLALIVSLPGAIFAFGLSGGDGAFVPSHLAQEAARLETSFKAVERETLARQAWAGELCQHHYCGNSVTEEKAQDLLRDMNSRARLKHDRVISWASILFAGLSVVISLFSLSVAKNTRGEK